MSLFMALAITANAQFNWGIKAGLNVSSFRGDSSPYELDNKTGFHAGINMQYMFTPQIGLESGLYYLSLGAKATRNSDSFKQTATFNPSYLQVPISFLYKFNLGRDMCIYPSLGWYFGYGIAGKVSYDNSDGESHKENVFDYLNRFDMGLTTGLNFQYSKFLFGLGYDCGMANAGGDKLEFSPYNTNFKASIGYSF